MAFNLEITSKYNYYFDEKFSEHKVRKPVLHGRNTVLMLVVAALVLVGTLYMVKAKVDEMREVHELKTFITAFVDINRYGKISEEEISLLAKEIHRVGTIYDLDPILILSVITVESAFNKDAISPMGARGLMQLLPATAKNIADEAGVKYDGHKTLSDIKSNITLGTCYLAKLSERYNNNMKLYLAAYNYGPEQVDRFLKDGGEIPLGYAQKILKMYEKLSS